MLFFFFLSVLLSVSPLGCIIFFLVASCGLAVLALNNCLSESTNEQRTIAARAIRLFCKLYWGILFVHMIWWNSHCMQNSRSYHPYIYLLNIYSCNAMYKTISHERPWLSTFEPVRGSKHLFDRFLYSFQLFLVQRSTQWTRNFTYANDKGLIAANRTSKTWLRF